MLSAFWLAQLLMALAMVLDAATFQFRARRHVLLCMSGGMLLVALHFLLLAQWTAAITILVAVARNFVSLRTRTPAVAWGFALAILLVAALTWHGVTSWLACTGALLANKAVFSESDRKLRATQMLATCAWLVHNLVAGAPLAVVRELVMLASNLLGYYRLYLRRPRSAT